MNLSPRSTLEALYKCLLSGPENPLSSLLLVIVTILPRRIYMSLD